MSLIRINLKPYWQDNTVKRMDVNMTIADVSYKEGERLCSMQLKTVSIPGCVPKKLMAADEEGMILLTQEDETPYPYEWRRWSVKRSTKGNINLSYTVETRVLTPEDICGPYFDFRSEDGGANSAGFSFIMDIEKVFECELSWDMSEMPKGSRGVCTLGDGTVRAEKLETLRESYFATGKINAIEEGDFGFYWMSQPPFDVEEVARYTKKLFGNMQKFFKDTEKVYRIFVRKDPFLTSGGTALHRSYMFGWNETQSSTLADKKSILAHEMVHNWPHLNDNPYGTATWYSEGTAEYYSVLLPLRQGLISDDEAIAELQKRTDAYYSNPTRALGDEEAAAICWKDRRAQRLAYGRGMIFVINTDIRIRKATNDRFSIDDVVVQLIEKDRAGETLGNELFLQVVKEISGLDVREEWEQMHTGKEIALLNGGFDGRFEVEKKQIKEADTEKTAESWQWLKKSDVKKSLKKFLPGTMKKLCYVTWPAISDNADEIAWVDLKSNEKGTFTSRIHLMNIKDKEYGKDEIITQEGVSYKHPCFLPNDRLAYLSDETGQFQLFIKDLKTNKISQITTLRHGILRYAFSDNAAEVVFEATLWPEEIAQGKAFKEMTPEQRKEWEEELDWKPYEATNLTYKLDEWHGMRKGEYSHIGTVNVETKESHIIDLNGMEAIYPAWSHDAKKIAFYGYPYDNAKGFDTELFVCEADGKNVVQISRDTGIYADHAPVFVKGDKKIIGMIFADYGDGSCVEVPVLFDLEKNIHKELIGEWDESVCHGVHPICAGALEVGERRPYFTLTEDGKYLYFQTGRHGRCSLCRVRIDTEEISAAEMVIEGQTDLVEFAMSKDAKIVTTQASWLEPAEIWMDGKKLTDSNPWLREYELAQMEEHWVKSRDKKADLQYFLVKPAGYEEGKLYPAVLDIKGGPTTMYKMTFWHEFQSLASANMAVIFGNPRGSTGFGREYCKGGVCWKNEPMDDLILFVEDAVSKGFIDKNRVGVTGGSYGGYMTNKLIGRTDVFAAAVTQRCLANTATSYGTGDMGFVSSRPVQKNFRMLDYLEDRARGNIISYIDNFKVPLLILHAYNDYRCGFEQAEQVFIPMKERNPEVPSRMVMFPGENHGMTRNGKVYHQIRHLAEMTNWFIKYLIDEPDWKDKKDGGETDEETA